MSERIELDELMAAPPFDWACAEPGFRVDEDGVIGAVLNLFALRVIKSMFADRQGPDAVPFLHDAGGLTELRLRLRTPPYVTLEPLSHLLGQQDEWRLPDMSWSEEVSVAFRFRVPAERLDSLGTMVSLGQARIQANAVDASGADNSMIDLRVRLGLPVLSAEEYQAMPSDLATATVVGLLRGRPAVPRSAASLLRPSFHNSRNAV
jgi:hypothetical protein